MVVVATVPDDEHRRPPPNCAQVIAREARQRPAVVRVGGEVDHLPGQDAVQRLPRLAAPEILGRLTELAHEDEGADPVEQRLQRVDEQQHHPRHVAHRVRDVAEHHDVRPLRPARVEGEPRGHAAPGEVLAQRPPHVERSPAARALAPRQAGLQPLGEPAHRRRGALQLFRRELEEPPLLHKRRLARPHPHLALHARARRLLDPPQDLGELPADELQRALAQPLRLQRRFDLGQVALGAREPRGAQETAGVEALLQPALQAPEVDAQRRAGEEPRERRPVAGERGAGERAHLPGEPLERGEHHDQLVALEQPGLRESPGERAVDLLEQPRGAAEVELEEAVERREVGPALHQAGAESRAERRAVAHAQKRGGPHGVGDLRGADAGSVVPQERGELGDARVHQARSRTSTPSTWQVCGNMSTGAPQTQRNPQAQRSRASRASVAGSHET